MNALIGVVTRGRDEKKRYSVNAEYLEELHRAGGESILLPLRVPGPSQKGKCACYDIVVRCKYLTP